MNDSLSGEERLANGRKTAGWDRTVSCSLSTSSEDGEADNLTGISFITALAPGRWRVMGGSSQVEAGMVY